MLACVAFTTVSASQGNAQALIRANVPFEFSVGNHAVLASEYSITEIPNGLVLVLSSSGHSEYLTPGFNEYKGVKTSKLVLRRYGDEYFLGEIWLPQDGSVRTLAISPRERTLAKTGATSEVAIVLGNLDTRAGK